MSEDSKFSEALQLKLEGNLSASILLLEELLENRRGSAPLFAATGHVYWKLQRIDDAILAFQEAICLAPHWKAASLGLFHCLWENRDRPSAMEEAKRFTAVTGSDEYMEIVREINEDSSGKISN